MVCHADAIDMRHAGIQLGSEAGAAFQTIAADSAGQAEARAVGQLQRMRLIFRLQNRQDRPKAFFLRQIFAN